MKNIIATAALSITAAIASTAAFADAHADPMDMTCEMFEEMDRADRQAALAAITAAVEERMQDETTVGVVSVLCNGMDDMTVAEVLSSDTDS